MKTETAITVEPVAGKLSMLMQDKCVTYDVQLNLMIRDVWRKGGGLLRVEIANVSLAAGSTVPDGGPYTLSYLYCGKPYEQTGLRVHGGRLVAE
jgi:hypothetical protein